MFERLGVWRTWCRMTIDRTRKLFRRALDGRDACSYSGYFWVLGRYDRPWGPERPIFGTVRYMSSENTARKISVKNYMKKYAPRVQGTLL